MTPNIVSAQSPFVDSSFVERSADDDPDLTIVRETYDASKRIQSIYLRFYDNTSDYEVLNGVIRFQGAEVVSLIYETEALKITDTTWGLPGIDYGRGRGLEGESPETYEPTEGGTLDRVAIDANGEVRFWLSCTSDIDDLRILVRYPAENMSASLGADIYHRRGPDPNGYPDSTQAGIVVGNAAEDTVPDDGDYGEVYSVERIKLRIEDLDVVESSVDLGRVGFRGGSAGPGTFTVDNGYDGRDIDADNGLDQNGAIAPIPSVGDVTNLRTLVRSLSGPNESAIDQSAVQILGLETVVFEDSQVEGLVSVDVPGNLPQGRYEGTVTIWEDNSRDGALQLDEPVDTFQLVVEIGPDEEVVDEPLHNDTDRGGAPDSGGNPLMESNAPSAGGMPEETQSGDGQTQGGSALGGMHSTGGHSGSEAGGDLAGSDHAGRDVAGMMGGDDMISGTNATPDSGGQMGEHSDTGGSESEAVSANNGGTGGAGGHGGVSAGVMSISEDEASGFPGIARGGSLLCDAAALPLELWMLILLFSPWVRRR